MKTYFYVIRRSRGSNRLAIREMTESDANFAGYVAGPFNTRDYAVMVLHRLKQAEFMCTQLGTD